MSFALSNLGDFEGALRETKRALELDPYYVPQKFELAMDVEYEDPDLTVPPDLGGAQHTEAVVADFDFDPESLDTLFTELVPGPGPAAEAPAARSPSDASPFSMAADYLSKGYYDRASAEINRALARGHDRAEGMTLLGEVFSKQGLFGEALERYRAALALEADRPTALAGEASALLRLGRATEARPIAQRLVERDPSDVDALLLASAACADEGDPASAIELLGRARRVAPRRADVLLRTGDLAKSIGDVDGAIDMYRAALELDADYAVVRFRLAELLQSQGRDREAERELVAALDAVPTYAEATLALAELRRRFGRSADAMPLLIELLQRDPYNLDALIALGEALIDQARRRDASHAFARVLRFDPENVGALYFEGTLLAEQHRFREASERWRRVIALDPASTYARRARRDLRSASDLQRILTLRAG
jgi:tetratricopeptide (TPR) repeat protein